MNYFTTAKQLKDYPPVQSLEAYHLFITPKSTEISQFTRAKL
jgi:hypothetical protein